MDGTRNYSQQQQQPYDLWAEEEEGGSATKGKQPKCPLSKYVPSLLPPVVVPEEGASYNPPLDSYLKFVNRIAKKERKIEAEQKQLTRKIGPCEEEAYGIKGLQHDVNFFNDEEADGEQMKIEEDGDITSMEEGEFIKKGPSKRKTMKQKKRARKQLTQKKLAVGSAEQKKLQKVQLDSLKKLNRVVRNEEEAHESDLAQRRVQKAVKQLTKRKRLGRGNFEAQQETVLVPNELPNTFREIPSMGDKILHERLKSLQQRNIVPVPGEREPSKLKARLRAKFVGKRTLNGVTAESRVI